MEAEDAINILRRELEHIWCRNLVEMRHERLSLQLPLIRQHLINKVAHQGDAGRTTLQPILFSTICFSVKKAPLISLLVQNCFFKHIVYWACSLTKIHCAQQYWALILFSDKVFRILFDLLGHFVTMDPLRSFPSPVNNLLSHVLGLHLTTVREIQGFSVFLSLTNLIDHGEILSIKTLLQFLLSRDVDLSDDIAGDSVR